MGESRRHLTSSLHSKKERKSKAAKKSHLEKKITCQDLSSCCVRLYCPSSLSAKLYFAAALCLSIECRLVCDDALVKTVQRLQEARDILLMSIHRSTADGREVANFIVYKISDRRLQAAWMAVLEISTKMFSVNDGDRSLSSFDTQVIAHYTLWID